MATGVYFGSPRSLLLQAGAYSVVDGSALQFTPPFAYNVVCVMGAALGGTPLQPYLFNDPIQAQRLFGAGTPLAEAIRFAFQGGVNGGAAAVVGIRLDNCGQAYGELAAANGGAGILGTFDDFGAYGSTFAVSFYPGSIEGTMAVVTGIDLTGDTYYYKIDNETSFSRLIDRLNTESLVTLSVTSGGTLASQTLTLATSQVDGRATLTDGQGQVVTNQAYAYQYPATMLANAIDSMVVSYNGTASAALASVNAGTDTFTSSAAHGRVVGNRVRFEGTTLPAEISTTKNYIIYSAATSTTFQVAEMLATPLEFAISAINAGTDLITAVGNTLANGDVVRLDGTTLPTGTVKGRNYFVVGKSGDDFQVSLTVGGAAVDISGSVSSARVIKVAGGVLDVTGTVSAAKIVFDPGYTTISASNPIGFNGSRFSARVQDARTQSVASATLTATAYGSDTERMVLGGSETWGHALKQGLPGSIFTIASGIYAGTYEILHYEFDGLAADKTRVIRKLSGDRVIAAGSLTTTLTFYPQVQYPNTQPANSEIETLLPANGLLATGGQYLTAVVGTYSAYLPTLPGDTIQVVGEKLAGIINADANSPVIASSAYNAGTFTSTITLTSKKAGTVPNTYAVKALVNVQTTLLFSAGGTALAGGAEPLAPRNSNGVISGTLQLTNGFDSVPTYQRWLDGLEATKNLNVRWLVPTTDDLGVQLAFSDHCTLMSSTPKRKERMTILGHGLGWTFQQIRTRAEVFQNERVVFVSPGFSAPDGNTGSLKRYPSTYMAARVAGALAAEGNGISDPITHTYLGDITALELDWQPGSTELDKAIASGVLTIERDASVTRQSRGYRVSRAITTWRVTVNSALKSNSLESISVVNQSDYIAAVIREMEESLFIGQAIYADTLSNIRNAVNAELDRRKRERIIYGYDAKFTQAALNADSPNAIDVIYKIYPLPALEFVLNTQLLAPIPA